MGSHNHLVSVGLISFLLWDQSKLWKQESIKKGLTYESVSGSQFMRDIKVGGCIFDSVDGKW